MQPTLLAFALALALLLALPSQAAPGLPSTNVAWLPAAADADIERAFAQARTENKPVLLYWGATWCPPCNQLKATFFNRQDFAALSKSFVAVHVDGDRPG
nr:thioredoxin family protein [Burkholderiaceae bacterium]